MDTSKIGLELKFRTIFLLRHLIKILQMIVIEINRFKKKLQLQKYLHCKRNILFILIISLQLNNYYHYMIIKEQKAICNSMFFS